MAGSNNLLFLTGLLLAIVCLAHSQSLYRRVVKRYPSAHRTREVAQNVAGEVDDIGSMVDSMRKDLLLLEQRIMSLETNDHNHGQRLESIEAMLNVPSDSDEQAGDEQPHDADDSTNTSHESQPGKESEDVQSSLNIASNGDNTQNGNGQENSQAQNSDANIRADVVVLLENAEAAIAEAADILGGEQDDEAGNGDAEAGNGDAEAGNGDAEAGNGDAEAGNGDAEAGNGDAEAGNGDAEAGNGDAEAGNSDDEAGNGDAEEGTDNEIPTVTDKTPDHSDVMAGSDEKVQPTAGDVEIHNENPTSGEEVNPAQNEVLGGGSDDEQDKDGEEDQGQEGSENTESGSKSEEDDDSKDGDVDKRYRVDTPQRQARPQNRSFRFHRRFLPYNRRVSIHRGN
ncbi:uncharacterized protein [Asterias amurensis]|uniref:uncharacterized protein n=1 Tax=Asterias amurensis TaxID=7602 RepID=UPI003AB1895E